MMNFLAANLGNIIVSAILSLMVALVIVSLVRKKKMGQTTCGCGCSHCVMHDSCHGNRGK